MTERQTYPKALVPSHLSPLFIKDLPPDTPAYISIPDDDPEEYFIRPTFLVTPERELTIRRSAEVFKEDLTEAVSPIGRAGIMRVLLLQPNTFREHIIADLRFLNEPLSDLDEDAPDSQEELNEWLAMQKDTLPVDAFIANEAGTTRGAYYGPEELYPALDTLRKRGNALLRSFKQSEAAKKGGRSTESTDSKARQNAP